MYQKLNVRGRFKVECFREGKKIWEEEFPNGVTNEGKNYILNAGFDAGTPFTEWNLGLIDLTGYSALAAADTYDNIDQVGNGWDEFVDYTDPANADSAVTRPIWTNGTSTAQSITNSSPVVFDITDTGTVKGVFVCAGANADTKGDHTSGTGHKLWCTALFTSGDRAVVNGDSLRISYTVGA